MSYDEAGTRSPMSTYWQGRVYPKPRPSLPKRQTLSILDASVARFSACGAIWYFDKDQDYDARSPVVFGRMRTSLASVLASYPQWAGELRWAARGDYPEPQRFQGRIVVTYGCDDDLGVDLVFARDAAELEDLILTHSQRRTGSHILDVTSLPQARLVNTAKLPFHDLSESYGLPCMNIQLTAFACGGYSVAVQLSHPLADAQALGIFMRHWASESQRLFCNDQHVSPLPPPVFDPDLLQAHALPITGGAPEPLKMAAARSQPKHRFSWWDTEANDYPQWALDTTHNNTDLLADHQIPLSPATAPPWSTWDPSLPVKHTLVRFTAAQTLALRDKARSSLIPGSTVTISRLDAVLAFLWLRINKARSKLHSIDPLEDQDPAMYLDLTLGARTRVRPPLPETFIGSPIFHMHVSTPLSSFTTDTIDLPKAVADECYAFGGVGWAGAEVACFDSVCRSLISGESLLRGICGWWLEDDGWVG